MTASNHDELKQKVMAQAQGAAALNLAFVGISNGLFDAFEAPATIASAAVRACVDVAYLSRWADAAFAFGYIDESDDGFVLTELGRLFRPSDPNTLMPAAVQAVLGAHMMERTATLMKTGERPGERVLAERESILPWFGPMLEASFGSFFAETILPKLDVFSAIDERGGLVVDLGCGNGWYLRALADRYPQLRGVGLDGFAENIRQANELAAPHGGRLAFREGDIFTFSSGESVDAVVMNRALHHVWNDEAHVMATIRNVLKPGGVAIIWEPAWPESRAALRSPRLRPMAFQNLSEHVQGNHFLRPTDIEAAFARVGMQARTSFFADGAEAVVVAERAA